jgi:hypothetical protein
MTAKIDLVPRSPSQINQVYDLLRARIAAAPNATRLPSTQELAREYSTHVATVHTAMRRLVRERRVVRHQMRGTFTCRPELRRLAVFYPGAAALFAPENNFNRVINQEIARAMAARGGECQSLVDPRAAAATDEPWPWLADQVRRGEIDALVSPALDYLRMSWLRSLPICTAFVASARIPERVTCDLDGFIRLACQGLARRGAKRTAFIYPMTTGRVEPVTGATPGDDAILSFHQQAAACGLDASGIALLPQWIDSGFAQFGYHAMRQLWDAADPPDSVIVYPDTTAMGVVAWIAERGWWGGAGPRLALHVHAEVPWFTPPAALLVRSRIAEAAAMLLAIVDERFAGQAAQPRSFGFTTD